MIIRNVSDISRIKSDNNPCKNNIFTGVMEFRKTNVWGILFRLFIVIWLGCITWYIINEDSGKRHRSKYTLGEYVYFDREKMIWHSSLECSKLNRATSKSGVTRETPKGAEILMNHQFCFECVKDDVYNKWMELRRGK